MEIKAIVFVCLVMLADCSPDSRDRKSDPENVNLKGLWYTYNPDSIYEEIILADSVLWAVSPPYGEIYRDILIRNDTIFFLVDEEVVNFRLVTTHPDSTITVGNLTYTKIATDFTDDDLRLILVGDSSLRRKYYRGYNERGNNPVMR